MPCLTRCCADWRMPCLTRCCADWRMPCLTRCCADWRMPCLTRCCATGAFLSHLLPGGCPVSPAARRMPCLTCCPEDALSHLQPSHWRMSPVDLPVLNCRVLPACLTAWRLERPNMPSAHRTLPSLSTWFLADWRLQFFLSTVCCLETSWSVYLRRGVDGGRSRSRSACSLAVDWGAVAIHAALL